MPWIPILFFLCSFHTDFEIDLCEGPIFPDPFVSIYNPAEMPPVKDIPLLVLNYWTYEQDEAGNWVLMDAWAGQCDSDCGQVANGIINRPEWIWKNAACIDDWVGRWPHDTTVLHIPGYGSFVCNDTFGARGGEFYDYDFSAPFFYEEEGHWVIPVDLLVPQPTMDFVNDWSRSGVLVAQEPPF